MKVAYHGAYRRHLALLVQVGSFDDDRTPEAKYLASKSLSIGKELEDLERRLSEAGIDVDELDAAVARQSA